jgi:hypothetical protein
MKLVLRLVETGIDGSSRSVDVLEIVGRSDPGDIAALGVTLSQGKQLLALIQQEVVATQCRELAIWRPSCRSCAAVCQLKDYRPRQIATLFGQVTVRLPRFRCAGCGTRKAAVDWPARCRSTPELAQLQAHLSTLMPYRVAAGVLGHLLPVDAGISHESMRGCTLKFGEALRDAAALEPTAAAPAITLSLDSTFIRSCEEGQRHLEVRLGNVEASGGARQVFAAVAKTDTSIVALIQRSLAEVGQAQETEISAFTDGCSELRSILVNAGVTEPPFLDWFHIAMRLHHAEKTAGTLPIDTPEREHARAVIVTEVDRLHWRIWNGKAKDAQITLERIRDVMPAFHEGGRKRDQAWRRLWKRCARSTTISPVKALGWSTMPNVIAPVCGSAPP